MMKKLLSLALLSLSVPAGAMAQTASSKATAAINTAVGCTVSNATTPDVGTLPLTCHDIFSGNAVAVTPDNFVPVMDTTVKVSNSTSLFVSPSIVTGLYTSTTTKTKTGSTSTATAMGGVYERAVLLDASGNVVQTGFPVAVCTADILGCQPIGADYGVTINSRIQTLTQTLSNCVVNLGILNGTCSFSSTIGLILQTTTANTFNFIFPNVGVGTYTVEIQLAVNSSAQVTSGSGSAVGAAAFGIGSVTVEVVRLIHDFSF